MTNEELQAMLAAAYGGQMQQSLRQDGTPKGYGWMGAIPMADGRRMTEQSIGVEWDGKEHEIPSLVPTLTPEEVAHLAGGGEVTRPIMLKAMEHAKARMSEGKSQWADTPPYTPGINPANMGLNAEPRSEWESYKYNMANPGRTAGEVQPQSMGWGEYAQEWYDRLIGTPLKGMAGAGDALLGKTNPDLESFEKNVLDALSLYAGPTIAKGMLGGVPKATELSIFGGVGAKEAPLRMRDIAEKALAAGKDPDEVWKYTGWKPGMEGKMRFEIDDRAMSLLNKTNKSGTLPEIIDHPELFKQYPELKDVKVKTFVGYENERAGNFSEVGNLITARGPDYETVKDVLTHEIQHWVQKKEGFARGGSPDAAPILSELAKNAKEVFKTYQKTLQDIYKEGFPVMEGTGKPSALEVMQQRYPELYKNNLDAMRVMHDEGVFTGTLGMKNYSNLAGEIEARDAATRRTWDTDMRRAVPPDMRKDAIIRMGDNTDYKAFMDDVMKELNY